MCPRRPRHTLVLRTIETLFIFLWFVSALSAQSEPQDILSNQNIRVDVNLVTINIQVKDARRHHVENLRKEDLTLYEDEVPQEITFFDSEPMPLSMIVLVDVSESISPISREVETTTRVLSDLLDQGDEAAVIAFSNLPNLLQEFTQDRAKIRSALERVRSTFSGATNINDSIYFAARKFELSQPEKPRVILLISDGNGNRGERQRAVDHLKNCGATMLGVGLGLTSKLYRGALSLSQWTKETGGSLLLYAPESDLRKNLRYALGKVRRQYALGYVPSNKNRDGSFRHLRVNISQTSPLASRELIVESPEGYFAPQDFSQHYR